MLNLAGPSRVLSQGQTENDHAQVPTELEIHQRNGEGKVSKEIPDSKLQEERKET